MPDALPPPVVAQQPSAERDLPGEMLENSRKVWLVPAKTRPRAAPDCRHPQDQEIVVCAPAMEDGAKYLPGPPLPDPPTTMDDLRRAMQFKVGPVEFGPGGAKGMIGVSARIRF